MNLTLFIETLQEQLSQRDNIVILTHHNPDGDAIGSSLALYLMLQKIGKQAQIIVPNDFPKFLKWLPEAKKVVNAEHNFKEVNNTIYNAELIFCLDFNTSDRIEKLENALTSSKAYKVLIDHHQQPDDFDLMYSDTTQPATCQMIYNVFEAMQHTSKIDKEIATCIYTGLITDTGNFKYRNTTSETHKVAASLLDKGIEIDTINSNVFDNNSIGRLKLLGIVASRVEVEQEIQTSFLYVTKQELKQNGFQKGDTEGFVNYGLGIKGINCTVFLAEDIHNNILKLSFRSKGDIDVSHIARTYFNGGGHINAAGGRSDDSIAETIQRLKQVFSSDTQFQTQIKNV